MKVHIMGASGSGVTTTGKLLADKLGIKYFDSDDYFWIKTEPPFTQRRSPEERNRLIAADLNAFTDWVLGGSVMDWGKNVFPAFDLIIFLHLPPGIRLERLQKRELERYGEAIYTDKNRAAQFRKFLAWAEDYDYNTGLANRTLATHQIWLAQTADPILKITGNLTREERIEQIIDRLTAGHTGGFFFNPLQERTS